MLYISSLHYDTSTSIGEEKLHMFDRVAVALALLLAVCFTCFTCFICFICFICIALSRFGENGRF